MNGCYSFNKMLLPDDGMNPCGTSSAPCPDASWFWIAAAVVGVGLLFAHGVKA